MANLFNRPSTGDIRGRLRERATSTVTGGPMMRDDDYLDLYLPDNKIKADKDIRSSSPQGVGATPVSGQPNIQSPAGVTASDITNKDIQDIVDVAEGIAKAVDAGQTENILSPLDPTKVGELEKKAQTLLGQQDQDTISAENRFDASQQAFDPGIVPHIKSNSQQFDTTGNYVDTTDPKVEKAKKEGYKDYQQGLKWTSTGGVIGRSAQMFLAMPGVMAKAAGAPGWLLDPMFSFLGDSQSIRGSHILGDLVRINKKLDSQLRDAESFIDANRGRKAYRNLLENQYDNLSPEKLAEVQMNLSQAEEYLRENAGRAAQSIDELYKAAHDARSQTSERNPLDDFFQFSLVRDANGVSQGRRLTITDTDGAYQWILDAKERNQEDAEKRIAEYREEMKVLHMMNDVYRVSDEYTKKREEGEFKWADPESWYYQVPGTLGSSFAESKAMAAQFITATAAHYATKGIPRTAATGGASMVPTLLWSTAVGGVTAYTNYISRAQESGAEVFDAYKSKIYENIGSQDNRMQQILGDIVTDKGKIIPERYKELPEEDKEYLNSGRFGKIMQEGTAQLEAKGVDLSGYSDDEVLNEMLIYGIRTSDAGYNNIVRDGINGLDQLWQNNMALGAMDMGESMLIVPGVGKAFGHVAKKALPGAVKATAEISEAAAKTAEKALTNTTRSIAKNMSKVGIKTTATGVEIAAKKIVEPLGRVTLSMLGEASEEGSQFMDSYNYARGRYSDDVSIFGAPFRAMVNIADAWSGALGISSDPTLNNDKDLAQSMKLGAVVSLVQGGAVRVTPVPGRRGDILEFADAIAGSRIAQKMTADHIAAKEDMANLSMYARKALSRPESQEYFLKQMEEAKLMLTEDSGITKADIDTEIGRAKKVFAVVSSPLTEQMANKLKIKRGSEDFQTLVAMRVRAKENLDNATNSSNAALTVYNSQFTSPEIDEFLDEQGYTEEAMFGRVQSEKEREILAEIGTTPNAEKVAAIRNVAREIARVNSEIDFLTEFSKGVKDFHSSLDEMNKKFGSDNFKMNKDNAKNYLAEVVRLRSIAEQEKKSILDGIKESNVEDESTAATIAYLDKLNMNNISYSTGVNMAEMIATKLNLVEAKHRNTVWNAKPGTSTKYGKKHVKDNIDEMRTLLNDYNRVSKENDIINAESIQEQHNSLLQQGKAKAQQVVSNIQTRTAEINKGIAKKLNKGKDKVSPIPSTKRVEEEAPITPIEVPEATVAPEPTVTPPAEEKVAPEALKQATEPVTDGITVSDAMASDYLLTGGFGSIFSSDYFLRGLGGSFTKAAQAINGIRSRYFQLLQDKNLADLKNLVNTDTYNAIIYEIRNAIGNAYNNSAEANSILDEILKYPAGMSPRVGEQLSIRLEALDSQQVSTTPVKEALQRTGQGEGGQFFVTLSDGTRHGAVRLGVLGDELMLADGSITSLDVIDKIENPDGSVVYSKTTAPKIQPTQPIQAAPEVTAKQKREQRRQQAPPPTAEMAPPVRTTPVTPTPVAEPKVEPAKVEETPKAPTYGEGNKVVTKERYEELAKKMRNKLSQLSVGVDPEMVAIGMEMAAFHIESGLRKFGDFANKMVADFGPKIKPYLKSFYEGARYLPGMEEYAQDMDLQSTVATFNVESIDGIETPVQTSDAPTDAMMMSMGAEPIGIQAIPVEEELPMVEEVAPGFAVTSEDEFSILQNKIETAFENVDEKSLQSIKSTIGEIQYSRNELTDVMTDPTLHTEENVSWLEEVDVMLNDLKESLERFEIQEEPTQDLFAGMMMGYINTDVSPADAGATVVVPEVQPVPSNPKSQEAGPDSSNITGTQNTVEFQEAKEELKEDVAEEVLSDVEANIFLQQTTEGVVEQPVKAQDDVTTNLNPNSITLANMLESVAELEEDVAQEVGATLGIPGFVDGDRHGLLAGTVFVDPRPEKKALFIPGYTGYENGAAFVKMLADPKGLDGADIFITVGKPGGQFSMNFDYANPSTWDQAAIYVHIHTADGKKYSGALRTPQKMAEWHSRVGKPLSQVHIDAHKRLRNSIIEASAKIKDVPGARIVPSKIRRNPGKFNTNINADGTHVFRPIRQVKGFNIPENAAQLESAGILFGVGRGARFGMDVVRTGTKEVLPGKGRSGSILLYVSPQDTTVPDRPQRLSVQLRSVQLSEDPQLLEYIWEGVTQDSINAPIQSIKNEHGVPISAEQLFALAVNFGDHTAISKEDAEKVPFLVSKQFYRDPDNGNIILGSNTYTREELMSPDGKARFLTQLGSDFHFNTPLSDLWGDFTKSLRNEMVYYNKDRIELSKYLKFDLQDTGAEVNQAGEVVEKSDGVGLTMLQWQVKNDMLLSDLKDNLFKEVFMYVDDVKVEMPVEQQTTTEVLTKEVTPIEPTKPAEKDKGIEDMLSNIFDQLGVDMRIGPSEDAVMNQREADRQKKINTKKAVKFLTDKLGLTEDQVIVTNGVIRTLANGSRVYGTATVDAINISTDAIDGTEYHEAWHRVSLLVLTPAQRAKMYEQARKEYPEIAGLTDKQLEEQLAEKFRDYMINNRSFKYTIQKFFSPIKTFIAKMFNIAVQPTSALTQLYNQIARGDFKNYQLDAESIQAFEDTYVRGADFTVGPNNDYVPKTILSTYDWIHAIRSLTSMAFLSKNIHTLEEIKDLQLNELRDIMKYMIERNQGTNIASVLQELLDNFETIVKPEIITEMERLAVKVVNEEQDESVEQEDGGGVQKASYNDKPSFYQSKKDNVLAGAKFFIATQPITEFETDVNGVVTGKVKPMINPLTGLYEFVDFGITWNRVLNELHTASDYQDLIKLAKEKGRGDSFFASFANRLQKLEEKGDRTLMTQILSAIRSHKHNMLTLTYGTVVEGEDTKVSWAVNDAETDRIARAYPRIWSSHFYTSNFVTKTDKGMTLNKDMIAAIQIGYAKIAAFMEHPNRTDANTTAAISSLVKMLQLIGIKVDNATIESMLSDKSRYPTMDRAANFRSLITNRMAGSLYQLVQDLSTADQLTEIVTKRGKKRIKSLSNIYENTSANSFVNQAAKHFVAVNPDPSEMMVLGPDGNMLYPIAQHNYMSNIVDDYNRRGENGEISEELQDLNNDVYAQNSRIRAALNRSANKVKLYTLTNFRSENGGDKGRKYTEISPVEDYLAKMALTADGHLILPTMADKSTYHTLKVNSTDNNVSLTLKSDLIASNAAEGALTDKVGHLAVRYFLGAFKDEFNTIVKYWQNKPAVESDPSLAVNNYHNKNFGGMFRHFIEAPIVVDGELQSVNLNREIEKRQHNPEVVLAFLSKVKEAMIDNREVGENTIQDMLQVAIDQEVETLLNYGVIASKNGVLRNLGATNKEVNGLDQNRLNEAKKLYSNFGTQLAEHFGVRSLIADHTLSTMMSIIETEKVFTGDPAFYNDVDDKIKRLPAVLSTGDNLDTSRGRQAYTVTEFYDNKIASQQYDTIFELTKTAYAHKNPNASQVEVNAFAANSTAKFGLSAKGKGQMNQTDATVIISPQMYMDLVEMLGEDTPAVRKAFKLLMSDNTDWLGKAEQYVEALEAVTKPLKMMHFGFRNSSLGVRIPIFDKMALFPMFKIFATGDMSALYDRMTGTGQYKGMDKLDMVKFTSAVKTGSQAPMSPYTDSSNTELSDFRNMVVYEQKFKNLRRQLLTDPHHEERQMLGSQVAKGVLANLRLDDTYGDGVTRSQLTGREIKNHVFNAMNALSDIGRAAVEKMFTDENGEFSVDKFSKELIRLSDNPLVKDDLKYVDGEFKLPLAASSSTKWMMSALNSLINDNTININTPGGSYIQMSSFMTNSIAVIRDSALNNGRRLKVHNTDGDAKGSMDAIVSINLFAHVIPNYKDRSYNESVAWLKAHNIIGNGDMVGPVAIGYRIPTQGMSSISSLRIVDVLPGNIGDTIVLPDEFTTITGSDFDIDKLYVARYNYDKNGNKIEFDYTKSHAENSRHANENLLLDMYQLIMTDDNNVDETKAPLDNTTEVVKDELLPVIDSGLSKGVAFSFKYVTPTYQSNKKFEYTGGKNGISPFALSAVHHPITQITNLAFKPTAVLNRFGFGKLNTVWDKTISDYSRDKQGYAKDDVLKEEVPLRVLDWLSAMINAHVDVAKDPYVIRLGINQWTYNMATFLIRSGSGRNTFYFLAQPILKEMSNVYAGLQGKYGINMFKSKSKLETEEMLKVVKSYQKEALKLINNMSENERNDLTVQLANVVSNIEDNTGTDVNTSTMNRDFLISNIHTQQKPTAQYYINQLQVYNTFLKLQPYARDLSDLVQLSQIDTKKFGNNFILHRQFLHRLKNFILHNKSFDSRDIVKYLQDTFLDTKIKNSMLFGRELFSGQFLNTTTEFENAFDTIMNNMGQFQRNTKDETIIKLVGNEIESSIKARFFTDLMQREGLSTTEMLYGENSMANRLDRIKSDIINGKYPELVTPTNEIKNDLLNHLSTEYRSLNEVFMSPDILTTPALRGNDPYLERVLIMSWEELYTSPHAELSQFARDLVSYAFVTSGDNSNKNSIFNLIPSSVRRSIGYADVMSEALNELQNGAFGVDIDDIYRNNWYNDTLVPHVERIATDKKGYVHQEKLISSEWNKAGNKQYPIVMTLPKIKSIGNNKQGNLIFPRYLKQSLGNDNNPETTVLYRYVGYYLSSADKAVPVYFAIHKKGMYLNGKVVREYNDSNRSDLLFNNLPFAVDDEFAGLFKKSTEGEYFNIAADDHSAIQWRNNLNSMLMVEDFDLVDTDRRLTYEETLEQATKPTDVMSDDATIATDPKETVMLSGGAIGFDTEFDIAARKHSMVKIYHFRGPGVTKLDSPILDKAGIKPTTVTNEDWIEGAFKMNEAVVILGKQVSKKAGIRELITRNWSQVKYADAVFAVGHLEPGSDRNVAGGTGYAVAYAQMEHKPIFLYDQEQQQWFAYSHTLRKFVQYEGIPKLTKQFAGIGTRQANSAGIQAVQDLFRNTFGEPGVQPTVEQEVQATPSTEASEIYTKLGDKTASGNVIIHPVYQRAGVEYAKSIGGVFALRVAGYEHHFGNPFTSDKAIAKKEGLQLTNSTQESVERYTDWVLNSNEPRAQWIRGVLQNGLLKDRPIVYYKELGEPSHATALDYLINQYVWAKAESTKEVLPTSEQTVNVWAGTGENTVLSNMYEIKDRNGYINDRIELPVLYDEENYHVKSIEHLFQAWKALEFNADEDAVAILKAPTPKIAREMGRSLKLTKEQLSEWDEKSRSILKEAMLVGILTDKNKLTAILNAGDAKITHKVGGVEQDNGRFSSLLTEIRDLLKPTAEPIPEGYSRTNINIPGTNVDVVRAHTIVNIFNSLNDVSMRGDWYNSTEYGYDMDGAQRLLYDGWRNEFTDIEEAAVEYFGDSSSKMSFSELINGYLKEFPGYTHTEGQLSFDFGQAYRDDVISRFKNNLNEMLNERTDLNRQEVEQEFNDIVKAHEDKSADSLNEALLKFICSK